MQLVLARIGPAVLDAVRSRPSMLADILGAAGNFVADFDDLVAAADAKPTRAWFDTAVNGTEPLGYDEFTDGPAFALDVADVQAVAVGLVEEGWAPATASPDPDADIDATARSLGAAAGWDPDEFASYAPVLAESWSPDFLNRLVHAVGAAGNWSDETIERVHTAVVVPAIHPPADSLAGFFAKAAQSAQAVVGGLVP
jgi:hypothetical protein